MKIVREGKGMKRENTRDKHLKGRARETPLTYLIKWLVLRLQIEKREIG